MAESKAKKQVKSATKVEKKSSTVVASKAKQSNTKKIATNSSSSRNDEVKSTLKIAMLDTEGKSAGLISLSEKVFGGKINKSLMAQAVRVYLANQRLGTAESKTRGQVEGSTRKIYRQKGTGRARHGGVRAPIFVKGGVAHGPHARDYSLSMPSKMKQAALISALSTQAKEGNIVVVAGLEKAGNKTKGIALSLGKILSGKPNKTLIVMPEVVESVYKSARNIEGVAVTQATQLNTYAVLGAKKVVFMKDAVEKVEKMLVKETK